MGLFEDDATPANGVDWMDDPETGAEVFSIDEITDKVMKRLMYVPPNEVGTIRHNLRHAEDDDLKKLIQLGMLRHMKGIVDKEAKTLSNDVADIIEREPLEKGEKVYVGDRTFEKRSTRNYDKKRIEKETSLDRQFIINGTEFFASIDQVEEALKAAKAATKKDEYIAGYTTSIMVKKSK